MSGMLGRELRLRLTGYRKRHYGVDYVALFVPVSFYYNHLKRKLQIKYFKLMLYTLLQ